MRTTSTNWVAERAKCNMDMAFSALEEIIERDVAEANNLPQDRLQGRTFEIERNGEGLKYRVRVRRLPPPHSFGIPECSVTFVQSADAIVVDGHNVSFRVTPQWDAEGATCKMLVSGQPQKAWQISQRALEALFFDMAI